MKRFTLEELKALGINSLPLPQRKLPDHTLPKDEAQIDSETRSDPDEGTDIG